jgi:hypothetical protein
MIFSDVHDHVSASSLAHLNINVWDSALALRVHLQKPLDLAGRLPANLNLVEHPEFTHEVNILCSTLKSYVVDSSDLLDLEAKRVSGVLGKRKIDYSMSDDVMWERIVESQNVLQKTRWQPTVNKWHARQNFGSEKAKAKMKVFSQTLWDQVRLFGIVFPFFLRSFVILLVDPFHCIQG